MSRELPTGATVGQCSIVRLRQRTGLSELYEALGPEGSRVRLSLFSTDPDGAAWKRFVAETEQTRELRHPALAVVVETAISTDGRPYQAVVVEPGEDLSQRLLRGALLFPEAMSCAIQIGAGLSALHALDLTHRGLCPERVHLFEQDGVARVRLLDVGVARLFEEFAPNGCIGQPEYQAPEQLGGLSLDIGPAADEYTLALLLYQALTSSRPFKADTTAATVLQVMRGSAEPLRALRPDVPKAAEHAIMRAILKDRTARFPSVADFLAALREGAPLPEELKPLFADWMQDSAAAQEATARALGKADSKPSLQFVATGMRDSDAGVPEIVEDQATVPHPMDAMLGFALPIEEVPLDKAAAGSDAESTGPQTPVSPTDPSGNLAKASGPQAEASGPNSNQPETPEAKPQTALATATPAAIAQPEPVGAAKTRALPSHNMVMLFWGIVLGVILRQLVAWMF